MLFGLPASCLGRRGSSLGQGGAENGYIANCDDGSASPAASVGVERCAKSACIAVASSPSCRAALNHCLATSRQLVTNIAQSSIRNATKPPPIFDTR